MLAVLAKNAAANCHCRLPKRNSIIARGAGVSRDRRRESCGETLFFMLHSPH